MSDWVMVLLKIGMMFLVMLSGWLVYRRSYLKEETIKALSRLVVDVFFPALVFTQMLKTINGAVLRESWYIPLFGASIIVIGELVGLLLLPLLKRDVKKGTVLFLVATPNWLFLPLPIAAVLFGSAGVRTVLLFNVGAQFMLWTLCVWTIRGHWPNRQTFRGIAFNPGILATVFGVVLALLFPALRTLGSDTIAGFAPGLILGSALIQALEMLGSLTIPLSLLVTGAQMAALRIARTRPSSAFLGVILFRLIIVPLIIIAIVQLLQVGGWRIAEVPRLMGYLIACMPVAISCSLMTERFGGDTLLAASTTFYSSLLSIATVPLFYFFIRTFGF